MGYHLDGSHQQLPYIYPGDTPLPRCPLRYPPQGYRCCPSFNWLSVPVPGSLNCLCIYRSLCFFFFFCPLSKWALWPWSMIEGSRDRCIVMRWWVSIMQQKNTMNIINSSLKKLEPTHTRPQCCSHYFVLIWYEYNSVAIS